VRSPFPRVGDRADARGEGGQGVRSAPGQGVRSGPAVRSTETQPAVGRSADGAPWSSTIVDLTPAEVEARIAAAACYASQLPGLFPAGLDRLRGIALARLPLVLRYLDLPTTPRASREHMASAVRAYVTRVGGERYWQQRFSYEVDL
jgi:LmbE family N-acetylglucosaminyl deacetylase